MKIYFREKYLSLFLALFLIFFHGNVKADDFNDFYKALKRLESYSKLGVNRFEFKKFLADAMTEYELLSKFNPPIPKTKDEIDNFDEEAQDTLLRYLEEQEIIDELIDAYHAYLTVDIIWSKMRDGFACISPEFYQISVDGYPSLKTWKWGNSKKGVEERYFELSNRNKCLLIFKEELDMIWAPCLFNEASISLTRARNMYDSKKK